MQTKRVPYTFNRSGYYYFSRRVPSDLLNHYSYPRVVQGLRTKSVVTAKSRALVVAAKLDAYRNLTEQLHGIYIQGETTIGEAVLTSDKLGAALRGTVIGARTVKIEPTGSDTYQVELAVSQAHVDRLIKAYRSGLL